MCFFAVWVFLGILLCTPSQCLECPFGCECFAVTRTVKCVSKEILTVPQSIPGYAKAVIITGNNIHQIGPDSFTKMENVTNIILSNNSVRHLHRITDMASHSFSPLIHLRFLDLSENRLALIHPEALSIPGSPLQELNLSRSLHDLPALTDLTTALRWGGLRGLLRLDLSGNHLARLPLGFFSHLPDLRQLFLTNNSLEAVHSGTFSGMNRLELLDLTHNAFVTFGADALLELEKLGNIRILLGCNPYNCSCDIGRFAAWLNESRAQVDLDAVRCASPRGLSGARLPGLSVHAIGCVDPVQTEVADLPLQTSYVFLGLVLGLVGMVFLFVLYLNRKGMKKWIIEMRDACRDVLEGYHYRYEMDSDPRLGHIPADNGGSRRDLGSALPQRLTSDTCIVKPPADTQVKELANSPPVNR
uniref:trophoblast glycoprotein-like isoform X1 n=1 Tax=Gasterosteus aculeatus aculeatus TaxID=481459 RepID=UPI001A98521B|nr:trophoblast glycoprotein-like isoform X1 [Gasterosteus aculeatus aculeatus]